MANRTTASTTTAKPLTTERAFLLVALATLASSTGRAAQVCPPAAVVEGDSAAAVADVLLTRGIAAPQDGCPAVRAVISLADDKGLRVMVTDATGRTITRRASTPEVAATVVESWARTDVSDLLLQPRSPPPAPPGPPLAFAAPAPTPLLFLDVTGDTSVAFDGSFWPGATASICFHIGPVCAGVMGRAAVDLSVTGASSNQETGRVALDGAASIDAPIDVGGISVRPGAFLGGGWMQSRNSPVWAAPPEPNIEIDTSGMRVGARVLVAVPLTDTVALDLSVGVDMALLAHTTDFVQEGERIAAEPLGFVRIGLGLGARR